uniref:Peptidase A1 domain-containing protein n=1 Tax=Elaeophora elaphi TaxID=1147741 RepID=A0A0R3S0I5_9BILA
MKVLIITILLIYVVAAAYKIQLTKIESKRKRLFKKGLWSKHLKKKNLFRATRSRTKVGERVYDYDDMEYVANISLGSPIGKQTFLVVLDTGSSNVWIPEANCVAADCLEKNRFNPSLSKTYQEDGRTWSIVYGDGSNAHGLLGQDYFTFGCNVNDSLVIPNITFGLARKLSGFKDDPVDGIVGLAFTSIAVDGVTPPLIAAIDRNILNPSLFTVWLHRRGIQENVFGGVFSYGAIDDVNCGDVIDYEPLSSVTFWQFRLRGVKANDYSISGTWEAISDTGTSLIAGPTAVVNRLGAAVKAKYNQNEEMFFVKCDAKPPPVTLIIGAHDYNVQPENYIVMVENDTCIFSFFTIEGNGFGPTWIFGDPFIRQYCQIYDIGNERIGFAPPK